MVFGKRRRLDISYSQNLEDEDDLMIHDGYSSDNSVEEVQQGIDEVNRFYECAGKSSYGSQGKRDEGQQDKNAKPLLDEVVFLGAPTGKNPGGSRTWQCKHCKETFTSSYTRIHVHFFGPARGKKAEIRRCHSLLSNRAEFASLREKVQRAEKAGVSASLRNSKITQHTIPKTRGSIEESFAELDRKSVDISIVTALCANGIPFNVLRNPQFCQMIRDINNAPKGYKAPSYERARTTLLDEVKTNIERELIPVKNTWYSDGVSVVSDGWSNIKKDPLINVLAVNSRGGMFLRADDFAGVEKTGPNISKMLLAAIDEVGPSNVVQVVTDNASNCKAAGREVEKVHPHIFWSPCVVHTLNLIFKDLASKFEWFSDTYLKGKTIVKYFLNHNHALTIFRSHAKLELLKVAKTRFASHYIMLKRLIDVKETLATTVVLNSWKELMRSGDSSSREIGALVTSYIISDDFWVEVQSLLAITKPIHKLIRICDKDDPIMGEIYELMDNMLGEIKDIVKHSKYSEAYEQIEDIVLSRWEKMNVPMHCLGFALSPRFYDESYIRTVAPGGVNRKKPNDDKEVVSGVLDAFEKIASDHEEARLLRSQLVKFQMRKGLFSTTAAAADASTMGAIEWWATYAAETPELAEVARKILSQPVTTSSAERNWSTYSYIHSVKRNRLNSARADKLVYIHSNIRMLSRFQDEYKEGPFKMWDVDAENDLIDDSQVKLQEMRWKSLDDDDDDVDDQRKPPEKNNDPPPSRGVTIQDSSSTQSQRPSNPAPRLQQSQIFTFARRGGGPNAKDKGFYLTTLEVRMSSTIMKFFIASTFMWIVPIAILYGFNHNLFPGQSELSSRTLTLLSGFLAVISVNVVIAVYICMALKEPSDKHKPDPVFLAKAEASIKQNKPTEASETCTKED